MRGNIDIRVSNESSLCQICIPKLVNYSEEILTHLCLYIVATERPVDRNNLNLAPGDYELLMRCPINRKLKPQHS